MTDLISDLKLEFWGDMQKTFWVENSAVAILSNEQLKGLISTDGRKAHKPIISLPHSGTYTPYSDISFNRKSASKQTLEVETFIYAADEVDVTDKNQTRYPLTEGLAQDQMRTLNNKVEQILLGNIDGAFHVIEGVGGSTLDVDTTSIFDVFESAETKLASIDAPQGNRVAIFGPHLVATIRRTKADRETPLGDSVLVNGVVGTWDGYTIIQNNNLPYKATLELGKNVTATDTVTIAGVVFEFKARIGDTPTAGTDIVVLAGDSHATSRANLVKAINNDVASHGTNWKDVGGTKSTDNRFLLSEKRGIVATDNVVTANTVSITGFGDIVVSETLTHNDNKWSGQEQTAIMGVAGMIDLVVQFQEIEVTRKEKGFADLVKSLIGVGSKMFNDGARCAVKVRVDASGWK